MPVISLDQARGYAVAAGFTGSGLDIILAIAQAESGLDTTARNTAGNTPPSTDRGILQINSYWHSEVTDAQAFDPAQAFQAGYIISKQGTDFTPWSTYTSGAYLKYMPGVPVSNVPAGDPGVRLVPFIQTFCEWLVSRAGQIATCVESSEMVVDHIATHGRIPVSVAEDNALADDLLALGEASPNGATNSDAASAQMQRLGIPNTHMHQSAGSFDWVGMVKAGVDRGVASIFGFNQAHLTVDTWTGVNTNQGVYGHGVAIVGYDDAGAIVADPNTSQAEYGNFVHYTWDNLSAAASGSPDVVTPEASMGTPLDSYFNIANGTYTLKSNPAITFGGGAATLFIELNGAIGLPTEPADYSKQGEFYTGFCFQRFERAIMVYDPQHKLDTVPGFGDFYLAHIDSGTFAQTPAPSDDEAAEATQLSALQADTAAQAAEIASLKAQLAAVKPTPASVPVALAAAASALQSFATAAADVAQAQKDLG